MTLKEVEDLLRDASVEWINQKDVSPLMKFLDPFYCEDELSAWARDKFGVEISHNEMLEDERTRAPKSAAEIIDIIEKQARSAYARREIEYPVEHALTFAYGGSDGSADNPYAAEYIKNWVHDKFRVDISSEEIRSSTVRQLSQILVKHQAQFLRGGGVEKLVDEMTAAHSDPEALRLAVNERFGLKINAREWEAMIKKAVKERESENEQPNVRVDPVTVRKEMVLDLGRQFFRKELTELEQFVLIQILDTSWKDHLYAMDILKAGIGLHAFAERDPRVLYKKEGYTFFQQMLQTVRDKVTNLIFRARVVGAVEARSAYRELAATHETNGSYGVHEAITAPTSAAPAEQATGGEESGGAVAVKTIVRQAAKVGRNDPCPCGSGKKYKKCCGVNAV
jgi:preprotein translocase subunit SecA